MVSIKSYYGRATFIGWGNTTLDLIDIDSGGIVATTEVIDNTRYGDNIRQSMPGYTDPGSVSITVSTDRHADVATLRRNFWNHVVNAVLVVLPNGLQLAYNGFISSFMESLDKHGLYTLKLTIKLSGKPTEQAYTNYTIVPHNDTDMYRGSSYGLFLVGGSATETVVGGEGAVWEITTAGVNAGTQIVGNTLIIHPDEIQPKIVVQATFFPNETPSVVTSTATYHIKKPAPSTVEVNGPDNIDVKIGTATSATYKHAVYPSGADDGVTWTITKPDGNPQTGLSITNNGTVNVATSYNPGDPGTYEYIVTAKSTNFATLIGRKNITIQATN